MESLKGFIPCVAVYNLGIPPVACVIECELRRGWELVPEGWTCHFLPEKTRAVCGEACST